MDKVPAKGTRLLFYDTAVVMVRKTTTPGVVYVRYARKDTFGDRASFAADLYELTEAPAEAVAK